jgi:phenylpyruvate tautomerase PptA (4-oxalocrotonate tautomerase family)
MEKSESIKELTYAITKVMAGVKGIEKKEEIIKYLTDTILEIIGGEKKELILKEEIADADYIFGHLEINGFEMTKGIPSHDCEYDPKDFNSSKKLKSVFFVFFFRKGQNDAF